MHARTRTNRIICLDVTALLYQTECAPSCHSVITVLLTDVICFTFPSVTPSMAVFIFHFCANVFSCNLLLTFLVPRFIFTSQLLTIVSLCPLQSTQLAKKTSLFQRRFIVRAFDTSTHMFPCIYLLAICESDMYFGVEAI